MTEADWPLIKKARRRPEAFRPLYEKHYVEVFRLMERRTGDPDLAADLSQQTFIKALEKLKLYKPVAPFRTWLITIALNEMRMHFRNRHRKVTADTSQLQQLFSESELPYRQELLPRLKELMSALSEEDLLLLELRYFDELPFADIAQITNNTKGGAKMRLHRLLNKLKSQFHA